LTFICFLVMSFLIFGGSLHRRSTHDADAVEITGWPEPGSGASRSICGSTNGRLKDSSTRQDRRVLQEFELKVRGRDRRGAHAPLPANVTWTFDREHQSDTRAQLLFR
jgi:hypothetical protein